MFSSILFLVIALCLLLTAIIRRRQAGFSFARTISHDNIELRSEHYGLIGRPDRIVKRGKYYIPVEKKPSNRVYDTYKAQIGVYLLLVEDIYGVRPPYGVIVLGNGKREKIDNTESLRQGVLQIADEIRSHRKSLHSPLPPWATPAKCRACSQRFNCT